MAKKIERALVGTLRQRLQRPPNLLQIVVGPRQVGKTTAVKQVLRDWRGPSHYATADLPSPPDAVWIQSQWHLARQAAKATRKRTLLVLDEVQKVHRWADTVKALFEEDRDHHPLVRAVLLGSAALHVRRGAQESLAGRFELHFCPHWSWAECREAFGWSLEEWLYFGGYPGAALFRRDPARWKEYLSESLVESVLSRDVLQLNSVLKPVLLRQLFMVSVHAPAQIVSYNKMLGQLQDAGNTVTLAHYLHLLGSAYLVSGLSQFSQGISRHRASSPKLILWNNALVTGLLEPDYAEVRRRGDLWGRLVENAVGAHVLNHPLSRIDLTYWREGHAEVDFVLQQGVDLLALEVKSGHPSGKDSGLDLFKKRYPKAKALRIGSGGIPLERFFSGHPSDLF